MNLPSSLQQTLPMWATFAESLAEESGHILRTYFRRSFSQEQKADNSPVTEADRKVEQALRARIQAAYPTHGIVGEEFGITNKAHDLQWVIDPIDGTRAFIAEVDSFVTLIALCWEGAPILGVIDQPIRQHRWLGIKGERSRFNGIPIPPKSNSPSQLSKATLATTDASLFSATAKLCFDRLEQQCHSLSIGGDGYSYGQLSSGTDIDIVCEDGLKTHDFAALIPVMQGADVVATDWHGHPITMSSDGSIIACANEHLHRQALQTLNHTV